MANEKQVFNNIKAKLQTAIISLPKVLGAEAVNFSLDAWKNQGWTDSSFEPWKPRQSKRKKDAGKAILVQTGRLRGAITVISEQPGRVVIGVQGVPYARLHNYGGKITRPARSETFLRNRLTRGKNKGRFKKGITAGRGFTFKAGTATMPRRQFIGRSQALILRLKATAQAQISRALQ